MASAKRDYYEVLGVSKNATKEELSKAYKKKALLFHPDRQVGKSEAEKKEAEEKFKEVNEAYSVLSDKDKRARYDQFGFDGPQGFGTGPGAGFDPFSFFRSHFGGMGGFGSMFEDDDGPFSMFSGGGRGRRQTASAPDFNSPEDGSSIEIPVKISFKDMIYGSVLEFDYDGSEECSTCHGRGIKDGSVPTTCKTCGGSGRVVHTQRNGFMMSQTVSPCPTCYGQGVDVERCPICHGEKRVGKKKHVKVKIPPGISTGQHLKLKNEGECGIKGGQNGDLFLKVFVEECNDVKRDGNLNLKVILPLNPLVATLGGIVEVQTPWKLERMKIPTGTTSGKVFKLNGQGIKTASGVGDFLVEVILEPLQRLSPEQQKKLEEVRDSMAGRNDCTMKLPEKLGKLKQIFES